MGRHQWRGDGLKRRKRHKDGLNIEDYSTSWTLIIFAAMKGGLRGGRPSSGSKDRVLLWTNRFPRIQAVDERRFARKRSFGWLEEVRGITKMDNQWCLFVTSLPLVRSGFTNKASPNKSSHDRIWPPTRKIKRFPSTFPFSRSRFIAVVSVTQTRPLFTFFCERFQGHQNFKGPVAKSTNTKASKD